MPATAHRRSKGGLAPKQKLTTNITPYFFYKRKITSKINLTNRPSPWRSVAADRRESEFHRGIRLVR